LGLGDFESRRSPVRVPLPANKKASRVFAGQDASFVVTTEGELFSFGDNSNGQLGHGTDFRSISNSPVPKLVKSLPQRCRVRSIAAGVGHVLALTTDGDVFSWGWNGEGQLGCGTGVSASHLYSPFLVPALQGEQVEKVAAGRVHSVALLKSGEVATWGNAESGRLGHGDAQLQSEPKLIQDTLQGRKAVDIVCGYDFTVIGAV